jgi:hypothetical protein
VLDQAERRYVPGARSDGAFDGLGDPAWVGQVDDAASEEAHLAAFEVGAFRHEKLDVAVEVVDRGLACVERADESDRFRDMPGERDADLVCRPRHGLVALGRHAEDFQQVVSGRVLLADDPHGVSGVEALCPPKPGPAA